MLQLPLSPKVVTVVISQLTQQVLTVSCVIPAAAAKQLTTQQVAVILQEGQVHVAEKLHMLVLHFQLHGRVPVNNLKMYINTLYHLIPVTLSVNDKFQ